MVKATSDASIFLYVGVVVPLVAPARNVLGLAFERVKVVFGVVVLVAVDEVNNGLSAFTVTLVTVPVPIGKTVFTPYGIGVPFTEVVVVAAVPPFAIEVTPLS